MTPNDRRRRHDLAAARYLEAIERDDFDAIAALWADAATDAELAVALREVHAGLVDEQKWVADTTATLTVAAAVEQHLPSAALIRPQAGPITVSDVADSVFRNPPDRLSAAGHEMNERLRTARDLLPTDLALSKLSAWAEALYGPAPAEYWQAFRQAALKLELRRGADAEYHLAARPAPKPEDRP
jgi:hypothetical protein